MSAEAGTAGSVPAPKPAPNRRPAGFWEQFNSWWRGEYTRLGRRPRVAEVDAWYHAHSARVWGAAAPTFQETRSHAKCLRTVSNVREYFRKYRAACRAAKEGVANPGATATSSPAAASPAPAAVPPKTAAPKRKGGADKAKPAPQRRRAAPTECAALDRPPRRPKSRRRAAAEDATRVSVAAMAAEPAYRAAEECASATLTRAAFHVSAAPACGAAAPTPRVKAEPTPRVKAEPSIKAEATDGAQTGVRLTPSTDVPCAWAEASVLDRFVKAESTGGLLGDSTATSSDASRSDADTISLAERSVSDVTLESDVWSHAGLFRSDSIPLSSSTHASSSHMPSISSDANLTSLATDLSPVGPFAVGPKAKRIGEPDGECELTGLLINSQVTDLSVPNELGGLPLAALDAPSTQDWLDSHLLGGCLPDALMDLGELDTYWT